MNDMKLTIQSTFRDSDSISAKLCADGDIEIMIRERDEGMKDIILSAFEAQTLAEALLKMAASLAPKKELAGKDDSETGAIEAPAREPSEMTLNEPIVKIYENTTGSRTLEMKDGREIFVSKEVWAKEPELQREHEKGKASIMYIRRDVHDNWNLIDTMPF